MRQILLVVGILGGGLPVFAQEPAVPAPPPPAFQDSIVVTASVAQEKRSDLPATVGVIPAEEIEAVQATQVLDVLELVPGVHVVQSGGPGQLTAVFTRGSESDQTLVLWNGIPLNDPYLGGFFDWAFLPVEGVERVEVVKGPYSSLYGSDALGGVVQVITGHREGGSLRLEGGEDSYGRAGLSVGRNFGKLRLDLDGNLRRGEGALDNSGYDGEEGALRAEWAPGSGATVGLLARANDSERGIPFFDRATPSPDQRYLWESREVAVPVGFQRGSWQLEGRVAHTETDSVNLNGSFVRRAEFSAEVERAHGAATYHFQNDDLAAGGSRGRGWLAGGLDWDRQEASSADDFGVSLDGEQRRNWAGFTQLRWEWERVSVDLGVRHDDNEFYGTATSPRAGVVVALGGGHLVRASYGEAFRAPSLFDVFHPFFGNPDVQPETGQSFELGWERRGDHWGASLVGFENRQEDRIDFDPITFRSINAGRARSRGVEGEVEVRRGIVGARLNATRLEAENRDTGQPLLRRPETTASLFLRLVPAAPWSLYAVGRYVGERPDIDDTFPFGRVTVPDYLTFDLGGRWQALPWLAPYARVENVADEDYEDPFGFPHPGRTWVGGLGVTF